MVHMDGQSRQRTLGPEGSAGDFELIFRRETLVVDSIPAWMMNDHYQEIATQRQVLHRPRPDWPYYMAEQKAGHLLFMAARLDTSYDLVGFVAMIVREHPHYADVIVASNDLHYLMPAYRGMGNGSRMLRAAEALAASCGASLFMMRTRKGKAEHGYIFEKMGYELTDLVYTKDLTHAYAPKAPGV